MGESIVVNKEKRRHTSNFRASLCIPYGLFMTLFVILPLFVILYYAFTDVNGFTLNNWAEIFKSPENWKIIGITFGVATVTTIICILIAYPIAYVLANKNYNKNKVLVYVFLLPMWINFVIRTIGLKELVNGLTGSIFGWHLTSEYPFIGIVVGMVYDYLPFAILPLYNQMLKLDKSQIEAAADLGAKPNQVFWKAIVPQTIPGIISACTMTFMPTMSSYVIADKMSENRMDIIGSLIQNYFITRTDANSNNVGSVLSLVMLMIVGATLLVEKVLNKQPAERKGNVW